MYKKNLSLLFKGKKLPEKRGESQLDCLSTKSFLARVVLGTLSPIFFKKNEIDFKKKIYILYARKKNEIDIFLIF